MRTRIDCPICGHFAHRKNACKGGMGDYCDCQHDSMQQNWKAKRNPNSAYIYAGVQEGMRAATSWEQGQENEKRRTKMVDKLLELYNKMYANSPKPEEFHRFQAGFTASAVSMRERAMKACDEYDDINDIKNAIGSLSDIPE